MIFGIYFLGPNRLSVIERCSYYRGVLKERLDCNSKEMNGDQSGESVSGHSVWINYQSLCPCISFHMYIPAMSSS